MYTHISLQFRFYVKQLAFLYKQKPTEQKIVVEITTLQYSNTGAKLFKQINR